MPELPEVETVRRGLAQHLTGARIERVRLARADLRFPFPKRMAERLEGATICAIDRRAKYLLFHLDTAETLAAHLGMTGRFTVAASPGSIGLTPGSYAYAVEPKAAHEHVVFELFGGGQLAYADPRRFGYMVLEPTLELGKHALFQDLGPEPLSPEFSAQALARCARGRKVNLKSLLLDQRTVVGLGNIYVNEALFRARLKPSRRAATLARADGEPRARTHALIAAIKDVLQAAIVAGGSTLRDFANANGESGEFQKRFEVYGRAGDACVRPGCTGTIDRTITAGRSTFACSTCQR